MLNKKVIMSSLLIALFSMAGIANAGIKLIKTTDGTEFNTRRAHANSRKRNGPKKVRGLVSWL